MHEYKNIFSPLQIGNIEIKNRIEVSPMTFLSSPEGYVTREMIEFYRTFARGGAGIVTIGDSAIDFEYAGGHIGQLNIGNERGIVGLSSMVEAVHRYGAKLSIELNHGGRRIDPHIIKGKNPIGPSAFPIKTEEEAALREGRRKVQVTEMNQDMIDQVIENFANASFNCMAAGFEMVMIHGGHGHLISQFASPYANRRTDNYGGNLENRARFAIEVLMAIRNKVGNNLALEYRISGDEIIPEGMHEDETIEFIKIIEDKIDLVHVSLGLLSEPLYMAYHVQPTYLPHAFNVHRAEKVKKAVKIPVVCVGSVMDLKMAEQIIAEGKADIVAMGRAHVADPDLVNKTYQGDVEEIRPCIRCVMCLDGLSRHSQIRCAVNPIAGRELEYRELPAALKKKKVVIVGGGPAGMEAAFIASIRGHHVTLYEREKELGGALHYAAGPSFKADMKRYMDWIINRTKRSDVKIKLQVNVTPDIIKAEDPDVLILAIGAEPQVPDVHGINRANVVQANEVVIDQAGTGDTVIVVGAGLTGCETGLHLAQQGKKVLIVDMISEEKIAHDAAAMSRVILLELLKENKVELMTEVKLEEVTDRGVVIIDKNWEKTELEADTVVLSMGMRSLSGVVGNLRDLVKETYTVGDCATPRNLKNAIHDAFNIAVEI